MMNDWAFGLGAEGQAFSEIYKACLLEYVRELAYMADCAELKFRIEL